MVGSLGEIYGSIEAMNANVSPNKIVEGGLNAILVIFKFLSGSKNQFFK